MLIRFVTRNFSSFNQEVEFSMIAGRARMHPDHVIRDEAWNGIDLLRSAVIYGANASGKSNLIKAMSFAQDLIVNGTKARQLIPVTCHKLSLACAEQPSKFEFEFKRQGQYYAYGFELDAHKVHSEWLYKINKNTQKLIFERETKEGQVTVEFGEIDFEDKDDKRFLEFVARGTRPNQLFLTESIDRNMEHFEEIFSWFADALGIIFPESRYLRFLTSMDEGDEQSNFLLRYLQLFDTGISGFTHEPVDIETELSDLPEPVKTSLSANLTPEKSLTLHVSRDRRYYTLRMNENQEIQAFKLMAKHSMVEGGGEALLEIADESDGTQRLMDLTPALFKLLNNEGVLIVDELDRSLHPNLSYKILEHFLNNNPEQQSQFIVTTHESNLLNLNLLRRDEIWFVEKDQAGASSLYSLEEFAPRYDKDIRKGYLLGRFGAIPVVGNVSHLGWVKT
jgi:AAA15 family ATPase/GTPase